MQLGVHFALNDALAAEVLAAPDDAVLAEILERIEEGEEASFTNDCDKAWDPISCALAPESGGERDPDEWPAYGVIRGDVDLEDDEDEMMVTYLEPSHVVEVAAWLDTVDEDLFRAAYAAMPEDLRNPEYGDDECSYAWEHLSDIHAFFTHAARASSHVVFHVNG